MSNSQANQNDIFTLEGGLLPADLFNQLAGLQLAGQKPTDYNVPAGLTLRDEIGRYWRIAQAQWLRFDQQRQRSDLSNPTASSQQWLQGLLTQVFGFTDLQAFTEPQLIDERSFPITHHAFNGQVPMVLCAPADKALDTADPRFGQEGRRRSPTGLMQEYLNANEQALWGIVSDGQSLRILRDNPSMTRPAFIEVDLATCFMEEQLPEFRILWLLLHASRFQPGTDNDGKITPSLCWLEQWRAEAEEQGERLLDKLRVGVTEALNALGNGFLRHPSNNVLRQQFDSNELNAQTYYQELLRLVYRLLFLLRAEARGLLHPDDSDAQAIARYQQGYSVDVLRQAARRPHRFETRHHDLWLTLQQTLGGLTAGQSLLALPALGGLFSSEQCPHLDAALVDNHALLTAIKALTWHASDTSHTLVATDYANMDAEELGSVYEALLELVPAIHTHPWRFSFIGLEEGQATAGNLRKLTGSYYTPDVLVQSLINTALKPVIQERLAAHSESPRQALLDLRVVDPACGSGHFLLAATRTLARELAQLDAEGSEPTPAQFQHALREVVQHCIYGVDLNPMAVELCRTALWMEALEPGKPLTFLDSHIQCGNALVGVFDPAVLEAGIPNSAYTELAGDDKELLSDIKEINAQQAKNLAIDLRMNTQLLAAVDTLPEESLEDVQNKREQWQAAQRSKEAQQAKLLNDLWTAAFFIPKNQSYADRIPDNSALKAAHRGELDPQMAAEVRLRAQQNNFFHWPLQFPEIFNRGEAGFDVVLGNPPWERIRLQEREYFATRAPEIAAAPNAAARRKMIQALKSSNNEQEQALYQDFFDARHTAEAVSQYVRGSQRFPLTAVGDVNLYALFAELALNLTEQRGRAGIIVPTGIATDSSTKAYFDAISTGKRLVSLFDFENREGLFKSVHRSYKFSLLTIAAHTEQADLMFFSTRIEHLQDEDRLFQLTAEDFALINPNTRTCPVFRSKQDAELTRKAYRNSPVLIKIASKNQPEENPWGVDFSRLFDMSTDSGLFNTHEQLSDQGAELVGNQFYLGETRYFPLYEGKMVHHYDHRFATYETDGETTRDTTISEKQSPNYSPLPRYWVEEYEVLLRTADMPRSVIDNLKKQDSEKLEEALRQWLAGQLLLLKEFDKTAQLLGSQATKTGTTGSLFECVELTKNGLKAQELAIKHSMSAAELDDWLADFYACESYEALVKNRLNERSPDYTIGWRRSTNTTNERTLISALIPLQAYGDSLFLLLTNINPKTLSALYANLNSLVLDWISRQKLGGVNFSYYYMEQLPVLPPDSYSDTDLAYIVPRVLELTYTSHDLAPFARDLGYEGEPFGWEPDRRHQLQCELDAYYAKLYGLTRDELRYILDPAEVMGPDYPSVTFPGLKRNEIAKHGEYLTQRRVLKAFDTLQTQSPALTMEGAQ